MFLTLLIIFSLFMFTVVFFVLREIMFHVSTLLPFSNGDSQQVIMYVTVPSRGFPPDTISVTPRLLSCKSVTEENQRTFVFTFSPPRPPPFKVAKAAIQQNFQISVCEMLTEKQN